MIVPVLLKNSDVSSSIPQKLLNIVTRCILTENSTELNLYLIGICMYSSCNITENFDALYFHGKLDLITDSLLLELETSKLKWRRIQKL